MFRSFLRLEAILVSTYKKEGAFLAVVAVVLEKSHCKCREALCMQQVSPNHLTSHVLHPAQMHKRAHLPWSS